MILVTALTKQKSASGPLRMSQEGRVAFAHIMDLLSHSTRLVIMNEEDPLILYTDASSKAIGGVLMQVQNGIEKPVIFVLHALSDQVSWSWNSMHSCIA